MMITDTTPAALPRHAHKQVLNPFRIGVYGSLTRHADVLFELTDAIGCSRSRVTEVARLSLDAEQERGHGGVYHGLNAGRIETGRLARVVTGTPVPTVTGPDSRDRIVLAVDVSNWLPPDAATSPDRSFCHTYARGRGQAQMIPGWPHSFVVALEAEASSWTAILDATRLTPGDNATRVTANQLPRVIGDLMTAGHDKPGDPEILVVADAGYNGPRLAWLLANLPAPIIDGTVIGWHIERLPGNRAPKPVWLWASKPGPHSGAEVDHWWSMFIRRFDIEDPFRFLKQQLGWTHTKLRQPQAAERWAWLVITAHTELRLARTLATDCRLPWQRPLSAGKLTPARVRAGYRRIHRILTNPASPLEKQSRG